jgi:hypothetical protein
MKRSHSMKKSKLHRRKPHRGGRKSRRGGMKGMKPHSMKPHHMKPHPPVHHKPVGGSRMKKRHSKKMSAGKRRTCPKYCRRKTVRCKSYRRVHRRHGKSHRRR